MNKFTKILGVLITATLLLSSCGKEIVPETPEIPAKRVERITIGSSESPTLSFTKNGQVESNRAAIITPEVAGKVATLAVELGDIVEEGDTLLILGDSLATSATDINYETTLSGIDLLQTSKFKTDYLAQKNISSALNGYYMARDSLTSAILTKENAGDITDEQLESLDDQIDNLKSLLRNLRQIPGYETNSTYLETKALIDQLESQETVAELGEKSQEDQFDFAIEMSKRQLQGAVFAVESVQAQYSLQFIQLDSQLMQAESGADLLKLQKEAQTIKAPFSGVVTQITTDENSMVGPGQPLLTIEETDNLQVVTSVNGDELTLLKKGDKVEITTNTKTCEGEITAIAPTLSSFNGKAAVEIALNQNTPIISGEMVDIVFTPRTSSIYIPLANVEIEDASYSIKVIEDRAIVKRDIEIGMIIGVYVEVLEGLEGGDTLAISQSTFLKEGDKVTYKVRAN